MALLSFSPKNFNPHSRKGSDNDRHALVIVRHDFNPHSRKGSDSDLLANYFANKAISIHTPARGVTDSGMGIG